MFVVYYFIIFFIIIIIIIYCKLLSISLQKVDVYKYDTASLLRTSITTTIILTLTATNFTFESIITLRCHNNANGITLAYS